MPRLFIGIPVPDSYIEKIASITDALAARLRSKVRWVRPGNSHITLQFLGDVEEALVDDLKKALSAIEIPAFQMRAGGCGCFPDMKRPRVVWAGVAKGAKPCARLAEAVADAVAPLGFEREGRPFKCHLTLGRIKQLMGDDWDSSLAVHKEVWPGFTVDRIVLWQSRLKPDGAIYSVVAEFPLLKETG